MKINQDKRKGYAKLQSRVSDRSLSSEANDLLHESPTKNALRQHTIKKIKL